MMSTCGLWSSLIAALFHMLAGINLSLAVLKLEIKWGIAEKNSDFQQQNAFSSLLTKGGCSTNVGTVLGKIHVCATQKPIFQ